MKVFVEMTCPHCGSKIMEEVVWISFATSLYKGITCPICHKHGVSQWGIVHDGTAREMMQRMYGKNKGIYSPANKQQITRQ